MAFVRRKGKGHALVETYREDGRVRQRMLVYLGHHRTVEAALREAEDHLARMHGWLAQLQERHALGGDDAILAAAEMVRAHRAIALAEEYVAKYRRYAKGSGRVTTP